MSPTPRQKSRPSPQRDDLRRVYGSWTRAAVSRERGRSSSWCPRLSVVAPSAFPTRPDEVRRPLSIRLIGDRRVPARRGGGGLRDVGGGGRGKPVPGEEPSDQLAA